MTDHAQALASKIELTFRSRRHHRPRLRRPSSRARFHREGLQCSRLRRRPRQSRQDQLRRKLHQTPRPLPPHPRHRQRWRRSPWGADGKSEIREFEIREFEASASRLEATTDFSRLVRSRRHSHLCTDAARPSQRTRPELRRRSARSIHETLRPGQLVILESTTYPGTTDDLLKPILESPREEASLAGVDRESKSS